MSWFGETFGDSLNSLKGQITKITKEVLAEDENENEEPDSVKSRLKELEGQCASKDAEINELRDENVKMSERLSEEIKFLRNENMKLKAAHKKSDDGNVFLRDDQIREICELENQLQQIKIERDHLEELQKDHQSNIQLVVQQRENYKQELEKIRKAHSALQEKYEELLSGKGDESGGQSLSDVSLTENQIRQDEVSNLSETIQKLQTQIESHQNEKEEMCKVIERHESDCESLRERLEKLMGEVKTLSEEKERVDLDNKKLEEEIKSISGDLNRKIDDLKVEQDTNAKLGAELKALTQTLHDVKSEQANFAKDVESQVQKLKQIFFVDQMDKYSGTSLSALTSEIETLWSKISVEKENNNKIHSESLKQLESDMESLRNEKYALEREIKAEVDKRNELECSYKKEIDLLQSKYLELKSDEQEYVIKSQTDDVKRLNQEVSKLMEVIDSKNKELSECYDKLNSVTQELNTLRAVSVNTEHELLALTAEKEELGKTVAKLENELREMNSSENSYREKCTVLEGDNAVLVRENNSLQDQVKDMADKNESLESSIQTLKNMANRLPSLEQDLQDAVQSKFELESILSELQQTKLNNDKQLEYLKAELIVKDSKISEQNGKIQELELELSRLREDISKLKEVEEELNKCKEVMIAMEMERQELAERSEAMKNESFATESQISNIGGNGAQLLESSKRENETQTDPPEMQEPDTIQKDASEGQNQASEHAGDSHPQVLSSHEAEIYNLRSYIQQQMNVITTLTYENNVLKHQLHLANENMSNINTAPDQLKQEENRVNVSMQETSPVPGAELVPGKKTNLQQHRRSKSDFGTSEDADTNALRLELEKLKETSQRQTDEYKVLQEQYNAVNDKEARSRKELERLKQHLIETRDYYVETIDEYKAKLSAAEEQLKNSSSFYTSNKVRDNQHLESLQSQNRLIAAQRDSLQEQLSTAQDEIQKQKAALVSLHVVLEQFQQDKERECKSLAAKYQNELSACDQKFAELQQEKESLNAQLLDAKNGLKAASRLGEQLEKKNEYIADLEGKVARMEAGAKELEEMAKSVHQSDVEKVDKSLLKNLLLGYVSSQKADRKEQVLRIMMSVLDFDEEERNKIGLDSSQSGWLSSLLHPKGDGVSSSQSLSEAFIRFLENESRPQPQLKLLPDHAAVADKSKSRSATPKPSLLLQELVLPTFNSPQTSESTILKDVLNNT